MNEASLTPITPKWKQNINSFLFWVSQHSAGEGRGRGQAQLWSKKLSAPLRNKNPPGDLLASSVFPATIAASPWKCREGEWCTPYWQRAQVDNFVAKNYCSEIWLFDQPNPFHTSRFWRPVRDRIFFKTFSWTVGGGRRGQEWSENTIKCFFVAYLTILSISFFQNSQQMISPNTHTLIPLYEVLPNNSLFLKEPLQSSIKCVTARPSVIGSEGPSSIVKGPNIRSFVTIYARFNKSTD